MLFGLDEKQNFAAVEVYDLQNSYFWGALKQLPVAFVYDGKEKVIVISGAVFIIHGEFGDDGFCLKNDPREKISVSVFRVCGGNLFDSLIFCCYGLKRQQ